MSESMSRCPSCDSKASVVRERREMTFGRRHVVVDDERMICSDCRESFYSPEQLEAVERRAAEQIRRDEGLLMPDEIRAIRRRLSLTQAEFEQLLGVGPKTVVRWERGSVCQNASADRLMRLVDAYPANAQFLRTLHGMEPRGKGAATLG